MSPAKDPSSRLGPGLGNGRGLANVLDNVLGNGPGLGKDGGKCQYIWQTLSLQAAEGRSQGLSCAPGRHLDLVVYTSVRMLLLAVLPLVSQRRHTPGLMSRLRQRWV